MMDTLELSFPDIQCLQYLSGFLDFIIDSDTLVIAGRRYLRTDCFAFWREDAHISEGSLENQYIRWFQRAQVQLTLTSTPSRYPVP
jgi:hypothetical protein